jgi:hypothetical protein
MEYYWESKWGVKWMHLKTGEYSKEKKIAEPGDSRTMSKVFQKHIG